MLKCALNKSRSTDQLQESNFIYHKSEELMIMEECKSVYLRYFFIVLFCCCVFKNDMIMNSPFKQSALKLVLI